MATTFLDRLNVDVNPLGGTKWMTPTALTGMKILGGVCVPTNEATDCGSRAGASGTWDSDDQWAQVVVNDAGTSTGDDIGIGLALRMSTTNSHYRFVMNANGNIGVSKFVGGTYTQITTLTSTGFVDGDTLRVEIEGTTIRVYRNGTQVGSDITDSSIASGNPGVIYSSSSPGAACSEFAAGVLNNTPEVTSYEVLAAWDNINGVGSVSTFVPRDCTCIVAFWSGWISGSLSLNSLTLNSVSFTEQFELGATGDPPAIGVGTLLSPSTGTQTIEWTWSNINDIVEGGEIVLAFIRGQHPTTPFRDVDCDQGDNVEAVSVTIDTETTDAVVAFGQVFNPGTPPDVDLDGLTLLDGGLLRSHTFDLSIVTPSAGTTTVNIINDNYSTIAAISLPALPGQESAPTITLLPPQFF